MKPTSSTFTSDSLLIFTLVIASGLISGLAAVSLSSTIFLLGLFGLAVFAIAFATAEDYGIFTLLLLSLSIFPKLRSIGPLETLRADELMVPLLIIVALICRKRFSSSKRELSAGISGMIVLLLLYVFISPLIFALQELTGSAGGLFSRNSLIYWLKTTQLIALFLATYAVLVNRSHKAERTLGILALVTTVICCLGILQRIGLSPFQEFITTYFTRETGGYAVYSRATSVFEANAVNFGTFTAMTALFFTSIAVVPASRRTRLVSLVTVFFSVLALILTQAKLALLSLALGFVVLTLVVRGSRKRLVASILLAAIGGLLVLAFYPSGLQRLLTREAIPSSALPRIENWLTRANYIVSDPSRLILGVGVEGGGITESQYVFELWVKGVSGLAVYLAWLIYGWTVFWRAFIRENMPLQRGMALAGLMIILTLAIAGLAYAPIQAPRLAEWYMIYLAVAFAHLRE